MSEWDAIRACALSGQMTTADLVQRLADDPEFAAWWNERAVERAK